MQLLKQKHLESLNLTLDSQPSKGDEWERVCLAQEDVKMIKMSREVPKSHPPTIYKCPQRIVPLGSTLCLLQGDRTRRSSGPDAAPASGRWHPSAPMAATRPRSNVDHRSPMVTKKVNILVKQ
jgi:hypothetical protein